MDLLNENRSLIHSGKLLRQPESGLEWNGWSELFVLLFDNYRACHLTKISYMLKRLVQLSLPSRRNEMESRTTTSTDDRHLWICSPLSTSMIHQHNEVLDFSVVCVVVAESAMRRIARMRRQAVLRLGKAAAAAIRARSSHALCTIMAAWAGRLFCMRNLRRREQSGRRRWRRRLC